MLMVLVLELVLLSTSTTCCCLQSRATGTERFIAQLRGNESQIGGRGR